VQSRAPEYSGSSELPEVSSPHTLAAIAGEPLPSTATSAAPAPAAPAVPSVVVPRLPGTPDLGKDGLYVFAGGGIELSVEPRSGSIVRLSLEGKDALLAPEPKPDVYSAALEGSALVLKSAVPGLSKRIRLDTARRSVEVSYTVTNTTGATLRANLADAHRVPGAAGLTFFPGAGKLLPGSTLKLNVWQPVVWFAHDQVWEAKAMEALVDSSEGWVASVHDGLLLVKVASDATRPLISIAAAYDAATKQRPFIEIAERSSFELAPGTSASCNLRLFLRKLPPNLAPKSGNQELLGFVRGVIQ
jgi:hypothetical protein